MTPSKPCETCGKEKCDRPGDLIPVHLRNEADRHHYDFFCHGSCQPKSESLKCCDKAFVWSGGEGTSHMCCNVHCCVPETDFEQLEKNIDKILEKVPTPPKERCEKCHCKYETHDEHKTHPECFTSRVEGWQKEWDDILHGTNPAVIKGMQRVEWRWILDQGVFAPKFNAIYDLFLSLSSRESKAREEGRKEGADGSRGVVKCRIDLDGGVCDCCQANFDALVDYHHAPPQTNPKKKL